ncbi:MAG: SIS domain-containing protein [Anaerolineae bacterium]|nr:SIS domain-containing protein [Anaerolineae bacterium]
MAAKSRPQELEPATLTEIRTQPAAWREAIQVVGERAHDLCDLWASGKYAQVIFTGCGSTYYLALAASALFQELTGKPARGVPAGELVMVPGAAYPTNGRTLLVAVSRSAATTETLQAVKAFHRDRQGEVVAVTNYGDRPLTATAAVTIAIPSGQEQSIAQTRSFASMYVATTTMAAILAGRNDLVSEMERLPAAGHRLLSTYDDLAQATGSNLALDRFYFLGSGTRYGLACEANLKMKEMTLTHSEPFHFLEFRHGPKSMVGPTTLVIGLLSEANRAHEEAVLEEMRSLGAAVLSLAESQADVAFDSRLPEPARNVLYLPVLQMMAYYRSIAKGLDPDQPHNLDAVVELEWEG